MKTNRHGWYLAICLIVAGYFMVLPLNTPAQDTQTSGTTYTSNLLILYNQYSASTLAELGYATHESITARYIAQVESANIVLENSSIPLTWALKGVMRTPDYPTTEDLTEVLRVTNQIVPDNPKIQAVSDWIDVQGRAVDADQITLVNRLKGASGIGDLGGNYSAVSDTADYSTLTHELGHNFGCYHDRLTDEIPISDTRYCFGYKYQVENAEIAGTIMSYKDHSIGIEPYFSSPLVLSTQSPVKIYDPTVGVVPNTTGGRIPLGIAEGQPGAADNARWMRERAHFMRGSLFPVILQQPQSITVTEGQEFTLTIVTRYPLDSPVWSKYEDPWFSQTGTTLYRASASLSDAGTYFATVRGGGLGGPTVKSETAVVTVIPKTNSGDNSGTNGGGGGGGVIVPPKTNSGDNSGTNGGGGGGAPTCWYLALLAALALVRRRVK